jgi:hypothetical protein
MTTNLTELIELKSGLVTTATVLLDIPPESVLEVEALWGPLRIAAVMRMIRNGASWEDLPEHFHWNWANKFHDYDAAVHRFIALECQSEIQSILRLDTKSAVSRMPHDLGKPIVYINFLESAPWNSKQFTKEPRFKLSGFRLIETAARYSQNLGYEGRIRLHSLPQSNGFYQDACGMRQFDPDPEHENLCYFELPKNNTFLPLAGES